jgi:hypothetical protein
VLIVGFFSNSLIMHGMNVKLLMTILSQVKKKKIQVHPNLQP